MRNGRADRAAGSVQPAPPAYPSKAHPDPFKVNEYFTLHWGDTVTSDIDKNRKISMSITGRSMVYHDDMGQPLEITVTGPPSVSLDAASASLFSKRKKLYPPIHWKRDLKILAVADDIDISFGEDDDA